MEKRKPYDDKTIRFVGVDTGDPKGDICIITTRKP